MFPNIIIAQINFIVGDLKGNASKIINIYKKYSNDHLIIFSELSVTGYPIDDLALRPKFREESMAMVKEIAANTRYGNSAIIIGGIWCDKGQAFNASFLLCNGVIKDVRYKRDLPNYSVFEEKRIFDTGPEIEPVNYNGIKLGIMICEDMWNVENSKILQKKGAELLIVLNASPYNYGKHSERLKIARENVNNTGLPLVYINQVGGQDELVFSGSSFALSGKNVLCNQLASWKESVELVNFSNVLSYKEFEHDKYESIYNAMKLSLHDYIEKNNFPGVLIGLSGGIDSAITAAIACDALGSDKVRLVMMPSRYTSKESIDDAKECASLLEVDLETIPIDLCVKAFESTLENEFKGTKIDITEENLQSRVRGMLLMALSNKFGYMVLSTGNKSEMAVGYATLYGDMCGGFNILKDVYKTEVYELCNWLNNRKKVIPDNIISKAPTAELRPNQKDEDSLPPYNVLDKILYSIIELQNSLEDIVKQGFDAKTVIKICSLVKRSEYKRKQSAPGPKISTLSFGRERRYPITNYWESV